MFPHDSLNDAGNGGGGNRTRVRFPREWLSYDQIVRLELLERDGDECFYCSRVVPLYQIEHVRPRSAGGSSDPENLVLACQLCNHAKWTHPAWLYMLYLHAGLEMPKVLPRPPKPPREPYVDDGKRAVFDFGADFFVRVDEWARDLRVEEELERRGALPSDYRMGSGDYRRRTTA